MGRNGTKYVQNMNKIFSEKPIIYTCVQGVLNDKIEGVLQNKTNQVLKDLSARAIEQVEERAFVSVSAYNKSGMTLFQQIERK